MVAHQKGRKRNEVDVASKSLLRFDLSQNYRGGRIMTDTNRYVLIAVVVIVALVAIWYYMYGGGGTTMTETTPTPPAQQQQTPAGTTK